MSNFESIKKCIESSGIEKNDQQALVDIFAQVSDENLEGIAKLITADHSWVEKMNDNRKKKNTVFSTGDARLWSDILEEEKKYIQEMTFGLD